MRRRSHPPRAAPSSFGARDLHASVAFALLACCLPGCAVGPGEAFGEVRGYLGGSIESRGRITGDGRLETVGSFEVRLHRLEVDVASVRLISAGNGAGAGTSFDPTSPPPGWLCHGDHCHTPDGEVVSFDEAAIILAGGESGPATFLSLPADATLDLLEEDEVRLDDCYPGCLVGRGSVGLVAVDLERLRLEGTVTDLLPDDRLGGELPFTVEIRAQGLSVTSRLDEPLVFDRGHEPHTSLWAQLLIHPSILDGVPFHELAAGAEIRIDDATGPGAAAAALILTNLEESRVAVEVTR